MLVRIPFAAVAEEAGSIGIFGEKRRDLHIGAALGRTAGMASSAERRTQ